MVKQPTNRQKRTNKYDILYTVLYYKITDGTQGESVSASADDKLKIAERLSQFQVDYVESGWPGSNPKDAEFFRRAATELSADARRKLVAFGSTRRKNVDDAAKDPQVRALLDSKAPTVCLVAKAHHWQVTEILRAGLEENLDMIRDTVRYLVEVGGRDVMVDLEHFFDGYESDPEYALRCCEAAADAGASALVLCDTNGGSMPWQVADTCRRVVRHFDGHVTIGIHCHNDCGMAVANSLIAAKNGVGLVQGTINGIGERTGNADLCSIVPSLALHLSSKMTCREQLSDLVSVSRYVDEVLNRTPVHSAPYVGASAFAHKGGLHVAAMERSPLSYQHVDPELVGNKKRVLISELSGRHNILDKIHKVSGGDMFDNNTNNGNGVDEEQQKRMESDRAVAILDRVKKLEAKGYTFEGAEASVHLMILHASKGYCPPFQVLDYSANVYDYDMDSANRVVRASVVPATAGGKKDDTTATASPTGAVNGSSTARATVKVRTMRKPDDGALLLGGNGGVDQDSPFEERLEVADGNGPVDALANALVRALSPSHPYLKTVELVDYKVRILDPESATGAATRVMIEFRDSDKQSWTTVSVDTNIISASLNALIDGFEYALIEHADSCMLCEV